MFAHQTSHMKHAWIHYWLLRTHQAQSQKCQGGPHARCMWWRWLSRHWWHCVAKSYFILHHRVILTRTLIVTRWSTSRVQLTFSTAERTAKKRWRNFLKAYLLLSHLYARFVNKKPDHGAITECQNNLKSVYLVYIQLGDVMQTQYACAALKLFSPEMLFRTGLAWRRMSIYSCIECGISFAYICICITSCWLTWTTQC